MNAPFWIGEARVDPGLNQVTSGNATVQLEHRVMQVLLYLSEHADQPVSREAILSAVWADSAPNDEGLTQAVCMLRKALGDRPDQANVIQTIRKKGYRLVAPVSLGTVCSGRAGSIRVVAHPDYPGKRAVRVRVHAEWVMAAALVLVTLFVIALII